MSTKMNPKKEINLHYDSDNEEDIIEFHNQIESEDLFDKEYDMVNKILINIKTFCEDNNSDLFANTTTLSLYQFLKKSNKVETDTK